MATQIRGDSFDESEFVKWEERAKKFDIAEMLQNGSLKEESMTASGLPKTQGDSSSIPHDQRLMFKQRAILLNHPKILEKYHAEFTPRLSTKPAVVPAEISEANNAAVPSEDVPEDVISKEVTSNKNPITLESSKKRKPTDSASFLTSETKRLRNQLYKQTPAYKERVKEIRELKKANK